MRQFIPSSLLTRKARRDVKHAVTVKATVIDDSKESLLAALNWIDASRCFVSLLRKHLWTGSDAEFRSPSAQRLADGGSNTSGTFKDKEHSSILSVTMKDLSWRRPGTISKTFATQRIKLSVKGCGTNETLCTQYRFDMRGCRSVSKGA